MPQDELLRYGAELGLDLPRDLPAREVAARIRRRQALLIELDREALLDVIVWSRRPVRKSAGKEELARQISRIQRTNYDSLPYRGLVALARLRGIAARDGDNAEDIIARIRKHDGIWKIANVKRRKLVGSLLTWLVERSGRRDQADYQFLPEEADQKKASSQTESLKTQIEEHGVVGGLANRLRGAADDYIRVKLDEIEARIDAKMDEIDRRLGEWRDREVANRLKILRITLIFTVLVAVISLGYNYVKSGTVTDAGSETTQTSGQEGDPGS